MVNICKSAQKNETSLEAKTSFRDALILTMKSLVEAGVQPWLILDVPNHSFEVPRALALSEVAGVDVTGLCSAPLTWKGLEKEEPNIVAELEDMGVRVLDPKPSFLAPSGHYYRIQLNATPLYFDSHHITAKAAELIILPYLRKTMSLRGIE